MLLAAGSSARLGYPKQLLEVENVPLVRRAATAAVSAGLNPVMIVTGAESEKVEAAVTGLENVTTSRNPNWESGLASSLKCGISTVRKLREIDGVLVMTSDQPLITADALRTLLAAFTSGHRLVAAFYDDLIGVPAIFGWEYLDDLENLPGDSGAGAWLRRRAHQVKTIPVPAAAFDIDTPDDLERLRRIQLR